MLIKTAGSRSGAGGVFPDATLAEMRLPVRLFSSESPHFRTSLMATETIRHAVYLPIFGKLLSRPISKTGEGMRLVALHETNTQRPPKLSSYHSSTATTNQPLKSLEQIDSDGTPHSQHYLSDIEHKCKIRRLDPRCA